MNPETSDLVCDCALDEDEPSLHLKFSGDDRPNLIADITSRLEQDRLYVGSIAFSLAMPDQDRFTMEILAKGLSTALRASQEYFQSPDFLSSESAVLRSRHRVFWPDSQMFHLALHTPDQEGLTARISRIVGAHEASFVQLLGLTVNAGGAEGSTPWFNLRATIASPAAETQRDTIRALHNLARDLNIQSDLWIRDLNQSQA